MSPISDGEIQAYLDGAYDALSDDLRLEIERRIEDDAEFAARVEEARSLRERASLILGEAAPANVDVPPFEELQRRAAAQQPDARAEKSPWFRVPPIVGLGWAATVVLALGVGWFVGQGASPGLAPDFSGNSEAFTEGPASATELRNRGAGVAGEATDEEETIGQAEVGNRAAAVPAEPSAEGAISPSPEASRPAAAFEDVAGEDQVVGGGRENELREEAAAPSAASPPIARRRDADPEAQQRDRNAEPAPVRQLAAQRSVPADQDDRPVAGADVESAEKKAESDVSRDSSVLADEFDQEEASGDYGRVALDALEVRDATGSVEYEEHALHSLTLPGLEVLSVSLEDEGSLSGLKILHRLPAGDTLELRYVGLFSEAEDPRVGRLSSRAGNEELPPLSAQLQEAALPAGWQQVVVRKEDRWVVARGPLSEAEIRAYLMTLN